MRVIIWRDEGHFSDAVMVVLRDHPDDSLNEFCRRIASWGLLLHYLDPPAVAVALARERLDFTSSVDRRCRDAIGVLAAQGHVAANNSGGYAVTASGLQRLRSLRL